MPLISKNKFFSNSLSGAFGQLVTLVTQILSVPFFMHYWGQEVYGKWIFLMTIPPYFSLLDLGMGTVISNALTQAAASRTFDGYRSILKKFVLWQLKIVFGVFSIYIAIILLCTHSETFQYAITASSGFWMLLGVYGLCTLGETLAFYFFRSLNQSDVIQFIWNVLRLLELILIIFVLKNSGNEKLLLSVMVALKFSGLIIIYLIFFVKNPEAIFGPRGKNEFTIHTNLNKGIKYSSFSASNLLLNGGTIWIINFLLGPGSTVMYSTLRTLVNTLRQIGEIIKQSLWPKISSSYYQNNITKMHQTFVTGYWLTIGVTAIFSALLWFGESSIFKWWLGSEWQTDTRLYLYLMISMLFLVQWQIGSVVMESTNLFDDFASAQFLGHLIFLLLTFITIPFWGLHGTAILLILLNLFLCMYAVMELKKVFSISSTGKLLSLNNYSWKVLFNE